MAHFAPGYILVDLGAFLGLVLLVALFFTRRAVLPFFLLLLFFVGAFRMQAAADVTARPLYPFLNEYVTIEARCIKEPERMEGYAVLHAEITSVSFLEKNVSMTEKVRLTVDSTEVIPAFGESFQAVCLFTLPQMAMNEGGFDHQRYLRSKKIFFTAHVEPGTLSRTGSFPLRITDRLYQLNRKCFRVLEGLFPAEGASVLQAMVLGDHTGMSDAFYKRLQVSGLSHMTAVSGMHVTTLVSALYMLFSLFKQNRYKYIWLTGGVILFFMLFTGASPSVVRASVMGMMVLLAHLFCRKEDALTSLALSAAVIVLLHPPAALDTGFMLSFAATLGILLFAEPLKNRLLRLCRIGEKRSFIIRVVVGILTILSVTISAQAFILPLSACLFGSFSLWSFITNLLATPLAPFMLVGGLLVSLLGLIHPMVAVLPAGFVYPFVKLFLLIVNVFGSIEGGLITVGAFSFFALYLYGLWLLAFDRLLRRRYRQMLVPITSVVLLSCFFVLFVLLQGQQAVVTFINVGNADCSLIQLPNRETVLIDGGGMPSYKSDYDVGTRVVLPYLRRQGIWKIDYMLASHPHEDHINGLYSLLGQIRTETLVVPIGFDEAEAGAVLIDKARLLGVKVTELSAGDVLPFSITGCLRVLSPDEALLETADDDNDLSMVVRLEFGDSRALFPGDLEEQGEAYVAARMPQFLKTDILKVAHHGADSSSGEAFLRLADPTYAFIPCGENSYGHPAEEVLERLSAVGAKVYRADRDKNVTFVLKRDEIIRVTTGGNVHEN